MILDSRNEFCDAQALNTGAAGKYLVGDVIDLENARDIGMGQQLWLVVQVSTTATSGGAATATFTLASDAQAAIAVDGTETAHTTVGPFAVANMVAGTTLAVIALPRQGNVYERYIGIIQETGTAAFTAGNINCFLVQNAKGWTAYPDGVN